MHWIYILKCIDGSFYVGETADLQTRLRFHNEGKGGRYTLRRRPVQLVISETFPTREDALRRERQLKCWSGKKKEALVAGDLTRLKQLSKRHGPTT